jgi:hypothetical protein
MRLTVQNVLAMARMRIGIGRLATILEITTVTFGLACGHSTAPKQTTRSSRHSLIGVYDVTTNIDSFSFEGGSSHCPIPPGTCAIVRPFTGGYLAGVFTIGDSLEAVSTTTDRLPIVFGTFAGRPCAQEDFNASTGCAALGDTVRDDYNKVLMPIVTPTAPEYQRSFDFMLATSIAGQRVLEFRSIRATGDTVWGTLRWQTRVMRNSPTFYATFRAIQRT